MKLKHEVADLALEERGTFCEIVFFFDFEFFDVEKGSGEVLKSYLGDFFYIHNFMHGHAIMCIFLNIVGIVVTLDTFGTDGGMATFAIGFAGALGVEHAF